MENDPVKPNTKSLYDVSLKEIAKRNFVAGFSHALGGFAVTIVSWGLIYVVIVSLILPHLQGVINQITGLFDRAGSFQGIPVPGQTTNPSGGGIQIPEGFLEQFQQKNN